MTDPTFLAVANSYLGCRPQLDVLGVWWLTKFSGAPDANAAQFYHFDMDRVSWIKFFVYFKDVYTNTGPHCFIRKSHQVGKIPKELLGFGYARLSDEEVLKHYSKDDVIEHLAAAGTVIAEDTRGLHKGKHLNHGDRLAMSIQYSSTMFGAPQDVHWLVPKELIGSPEIEKRVKNHPRAYRKFFKI